MNTVESPRRSTACENCWNPMRRASTVSWAFRGDFMTKHPERSARPVVVYPPSKFSVANGIGAPFTSRTTPATEETPGRLKFGQSSRGVLVLSADWPIRALPVNPIAATARIEQRAERLMTLSLHRWGEFLKGGRRLLTASANDVC